MGKDGNIEPQKNGDIENRLKEVNRLAPKINLMNVNEVKNEKKIHKFFPFFRIDFKLGLVLRCRRFQCYGRIRCYRLLTSKFCNQFLSFYKKKFEVDLELQVAINIM